MLFAYLFARFTSLFNLPRGVEYSLVPVDAVSYFPSTGLLRGSCSYALQSSLIHRLDSGLDAIIFSATQFENVFVR